MNFSCTEFRRGGAPNSRALVGDAMDGDRLAVEELLRNSSRNSVHKLKHYLYFPSKRAARVAAAKLREQSFGVEERLGADGVNWLVLARQEIVPSPELVATVRASLEQVAAMGGGEYDGWEAETVVPGQME
jgi:Regulator of ribonuclease activity B